MVVYITHGAKKNVGDYLIHSRARKLWNQLRPRDELTSIPRWHEGSLPDDAEHLILCGGPGFASRMIENVFPVAASALQDGVSVSTLALGWEGSPSRRPQDFEMSASSLAVMRKISESGGPISVRDDVTKEIAERLGIEANVTGCTAWYSLSHLGMKTPVASADPKIIVYTTPAQWNHAVESARVMRWLSQRYPTAQLIAVFHRGIRRDSETSLRQSVPLMAQAASARRLGFQVVDASYDLSRIDFYRQADLHIGYRVHAHLDFVSRRVPSVLISEDGRGFGQTAALHGTSVLLWAGDAAILSKLDSLLTTETSQNWPSLDRAIERIESQYGAMSNHILES